MSATVIIAIVLVVALFGVGALLATSTPRDASRAWFDVASRYSLHYRSTNTEAGKMLQLEGRLEGVSVEVETEPSKDGERIVATVARARFSRPLPEAFELVHEGMIQKLSKLGGAQDIEVDLPDVDGMFVIRGSDPEAIRRLLQADRVRQALVALHQSHRHAHITAAHVTVRISGLAEGAALEGALRRLVDLVEAVERTLEGEVS